MDEPRSRDLHPTIDQRFRTEQYPPIPPETDTPPVSGRVQHVQVTYGPPATKRRRKRRPKRSVAAKASARVRVSAVNGWIIAWAGFWYVSFQLPMAILSAVGFGISAAIYALVANLTESDGFLSGVIDATVGVEIFTDLARAIATAALRFYGLSFDPLILFLLPFIVLFALGLLQLMSAWFVYAMCGLKPLSGRASTAKIATFLLALIGICIPLLNLFPLIVVWCLVVWLYPT